MANLNHANKSVSSSRFDSFVHQYPLTKTIQFGLIPVGNTKEKFLDNGVLEADKIRSQNYKIVKQYVDMFHKNHIDHVLSDENVREALVMLSEYADLYAITNKTDDDKKRMAKLEADARKVISNAFTNRDGYKDLFGKPMLTDLLPAFFADDPEATYYINSFKKFVGYFNGLFDNRKNLYSAEEKHSTVAYRCINENLPKFLDNMATFYRKIKPALPKENLDALNDECEAMFGFDLDVLFSITGFGYCLPQSGIELYNSVIGGYSNSDGSKVQGMNEYINEYNHTVDKKDKLPLLNALFKQILSDRQSVSFIPKKFSSDEELLAALKSFFCEAFYDGKKFIDVANDLADIFSRISEYNMNGIYVSEKYISNMSVEMFKYWGALTCAWYDAYKKANPMGRKKPESYDKEMRKAYKRNKSFSLAEIDTLAQNVEVEEEDEGKVCRSVSEWLKTTIVNNIQDIRDAYDKCEALIEKGRTSKKSLASNNEATANLKALVDAMKAFERTAKLLIGNKEDVERDDVFYGDYLSMTESLSVINDLYNKVRNRLSEKPYSQDKIKLTFNISGLMNGWVESKTELSDAGTQYGSYLFRRLNGIGEYDYFIGFSEDKRRFRFFKEVKAVDKSGYERLNYYQPKLTTIYGTAYCGENTYATDKDIMYDIFVRIANECGNRDIVDYIVDLRSKPMNSPLGCFRWIAQNHPDVYSVILQDESFKIHNQTIIDNLLTTLKRMPRIPDPGDIFTKKYELFSEIINDIEELKKKKDFQYTAVSAIEMEQAMADKDKPFYLYQISNRDLSYATSYLAGKRKSRGKDDLFTMFLKTVLSGDQCVFDLGSGEVFYREASIPAHVTHPANEPIANKNKLNPKKESVYSYDLIKDRRYTKDQLMLHMSVTMNYTDDKKSLIDMNKELQDVIAQNPDQYVIGIDRGERNLVYICVINGNGEIVEQRSLNLITSDNGYSVDYHKLLVERENLRKEDRENWKAATQIKDLKKGYLSQVVNEIVKLVIKYDAIIVLEDLNEKFKDHRKKVERSIYQQFEKALIDKLSYLVTSKDYADAKKPGGVQNAYQLAQTDPKNKSKQNGIIFFVNPWNTSNIDPVTGFVDLIHPRCETDAEFVSFFSKFDDIRYNADEDLFEFTFDYSKFPYSGYCPVKKWTACSVGDRIQRSKKDEMNNVTIHLTSEFKELFKKFAIDFNVDLKNQILEKHNKEFQKTFTRLVGLMLQLRNTRPDYDSRDDDYILSPVRGADGRFFDSRDYKGDIHAKLPGDADANGAYNIARKGMILVDRIKAESAANDLKADDDVDDKKKNVNLLVKNVEYLELAQNA